MLDPQKEGLDLQCERLALEGRLVQKVLGNVLGPFLFSFNL